MQKPANELAEETQAIIQQLLADGSAPDALYIIEHHVAHDSFEQLEKLAIEAYELDYEISDAEEVSIENEVYFCCDIVVESNLSEEIIEKQQKVLLPIIEKYGAFYEGWGTYFEDPNDNDEYADSIEFVDEEE